MYMSDLKAATTCDNEIIHVFKKGIAKKNKIYIHIYIFPIPPWLINTSLIIWNHSKTVLNI